MTGMSNIMLACKITLKLQILSLHRIKGQCFKSNLHWYACDIHKSKFRSTALTVSRTAYGTGLSKAGALVYAYYSILLKSPDFTKP